MLPAGVGRELGRQGRGNPETLQNGVVKSGYRADTAAGEGEDQHAAGAGDAGRRVLEVHDQRGLAIGPGRNRPVGGAGPENGRVEERAPLMAGSQPGRITRTAYDSLVTQNMRHGPFVLVATTTTFFCAGCHNHDK